MLEQNKQSTDNFQGEKTASIDCKNTSVSNDTSPTISADDINQQWCHIKELLRNEIGNAAYKNWIEKLNVKSIENGCLEIAVPTRFIGNWIKSHYANRIRALWSTELYTLSSVECTVLTSSSASRTKKSPNSANGGKTPNAIVKKTSSKNYNSMANKTASDQLNILDDMRGNLDPRLTFDNFIVGKPNELAYAAARRVTENETPSFNPLFLYGGVGLGKTHLMHAIAWAIHENTPDRKVLYMSAEKFMYQFVRALRFKNTVSFKEQFRSVDVLMIDDVQFIGGKESTQEEFFHTFNALVEQNRQIIISADKSPSDLEGMEERLRSRLGWGLVADIHPTTYELRLGILEARCAELNQIIPKNVIEFLAHKITSNIRELEGALNRIVAHADLIGRTITMDTTQDLLRDLLRANNRHITIEDIQRKVAEHYNIRTSDMHSARRARNIARPRQIAMYLSKQLTECSLPEIGRRFGGRDHTTIMHGVRKIEELIPTHPEMAADIELLNRALTV